MGKPKIAILTGSGISSESGIKTYRGPAGLWNNCKIEDVASIDGWIRDPKLVLDFFNEQRKSIRQANPNVAHMELCKLESRFHVDIITQNIDDLHERAGSTNVIHVHGNINEARSSVDENLVCRIEGNNMSIGDMCPKKSQLRPNVVFFDENVPKISQALELVQNAQIVIVIGTSLKVNPTARLLDYVAPETPLFCVDKYSDGIRGRDVIFIKEKATVGVPQMVDSILKYVRIR